MLTVLIAIVANSLSAVQVTRIEYSYKEKATLICELSKNYLLRLVSRPKSNLHTTNLLFVSFLESPTEENEGEDQNFNIAQTISEVKEIMKNTT